MQIVKLFAAPLLLRFVCQSRYGDLLHRPFVVIQPLPNPLSVYCGIAKRATVRSADLLAVIRFLIRITVTLGTGKEGRLTGFEGFTLMLSMASCATNARMLMRLN